MTLRRKQTIVVQEVHAAMVLRKRRYMKETDLIMRSQIEATRISDVAARYSISFSSKLMM